MFFSSNCGYQWTHTTYHKDDPQSIMKSHSRHASLGYHLPTIWVEIGK